MVEEVRANGVRSWAESGDLSDHEAVGRLFRRLDAEFGGLDIFVGNAGIWPVPEVPVAEMDHARWRRTIAVNLDSIFFTTREALSRMSDGGRVVLLSSTAGQRGEAYHCDYAASKGAIISLVKGLCSEVGHRGITVNAVAPGWIDTEMSRDPLQGEDRAAIETSIPLGKVATAEDVAGPIVMLCAEMARHITGEVVNVNGGSGACRVRSEMEGEGTLAGRSERSVAAAGHPARIRVPKAVRELVRALEVEGFETWTVGGGVRDAVRGSPGNPGGLGPGHPGDAPSGAPALPPDRAAGRGIRDRGCVRLGRQSLRGHDLSPRCDHLRTQGQGGLRRHAGRGPGPP